jgi:putative membrane protein
MISLSKLDFARLLKFRRKEKENEPLVKPNKVVETLKKDLILREQLALQRTILANQSTFLAFLRTAMYFSIVALSARNLLQIENSLLVEIIFFVISGFILLFGIINFFRHKRMIKDNRKHIGDYQLQYHE